MKSPQEKRQMGKLRPRGLQPQSPDRTGSSLKVRWGSGDWWLIWEWGGDTAWP